MDGRLGVTRAAASTGPVLVVATATTAAATTAAAARTAAGTASAAPAVAFRVHLRPAVPHFTTIRARLNTVTHHKTDGWLD